MLHAVVRCFKSIAFRTRLQRYRNLRSRRSCSGWQTEALEQRLVLSPGILAVGSDLGSPAAVRVFDSATNDFLYDILPYADFPNFRGGVRTAVADYNADGVFDVVTAPGPGISPLIRVFDGGNPSRIIKEFFAYDEFFLGGVYVAAGDMNRDGFPEIVTGAGQGGGPHVRVFDGRFGFVRFNEFVYSPFFLGGVRVATGDVNGDTYQDFITAAGPGGGPHVRVFNGFNSHQLEGPIGSFYAYNPLFAGGVYVASANFGGASPAAEVVTGAGEGGGPHVRIIDPQGPNPNEPLFDLNRFTTQFPLPGTFTGGVRVAAAYVDNQDAIADLIVGTGPGAPPQLRVFLGPTDIELYHRSLNQVSPNGGIFPSSGKRIGEPLRAASAAISLAEGTAELTPEEIAPLIAEAIVRWESAGVSQAALGDLRNLTFQITDLNSDLLGLARPGVILLDRNAAGHGWFIDSTPNRDEEFDENGFSLGQVGGVDLLTVIAHEMGHHLGLDDLDAPTLSQHLMASLIAPGERHLLEIPFADPDLLAQL